MPNPLYFAPMCLILFAYRQHPEYPLILIANRDEYYARPTRDAHWWEANGIFAGRDLEAGGSWLGVNRQGRFAAVTNVREPGANKPAARSRGDLTREFLEGAQHPVDYLQQLSESDQEFAGFNLLLGDQQGLWFYSNRDHGMRGIEPGVHGLSNGGFDEAWPKLSSGKRELEAVIGGQFDADDLLAILTDHQTASDHELPATGVSLDIERLLSSRFIRSTDYGTRACTVLLMANRQIRFYEQNFTDAQTRGASVAETIDLSGD